MKKEISVFLENEKNTSELGLKLSEKLTAGLLLFLKGDLGAGKTCLVRSILMSLGFEGKVKSPSYSLFEQYIIDGKPLTTLIYIVLKVLKNGLLQGLMIILISMTLR